MATIVVDSTPAEHFAMIPNRFSRNPDVTPRAARIFLYLMSNSAGWETSADRMAKILKMGEGTVKAALNDLEGLGYLARRQIHDEHGKFLRKEYRLFPNPFTVVQNPSDGGNPQVTTAVQNASDGEYSESTTAVQNTSDGATCDNQVNPQVGTDRQKTASGKLTPLRRSTLKKTNKPKEDQPPKAPQGATADPAGSSSDLAIMDAEIIEDPHPGQSLMLPGIDGTLEVVTEPKPIPKKRGQKTIRPDYTPAFEEFWGLYPGLRQGKAKAFDLWLDAIHADHIAPSVMTHAARQAAAYSRATGQDPAFNRQLPRWFDERGWEDLPQLQADTKLPRRVLDEISIQQQTEEIHRAQQAYIAGYGPEGYREGDILPHAPGTPAPIMVPAVW